MFGCRSITAVMLMVAKQSYPNAETTVDDRFKFELAPPSTQCSSIDEEEKKWHAAHSVKLGAQFRSV